MITSGELARAWSTTVRTFFVGASIGAVAGVLLGLIASLVWPVRTVLTPLFVALWATPVIALVPLIIIWFGVGELGRLCLVGFAAAAPIYLNAESGFTEARPDLLEVARSFSARRADLVRHVILPGAIPYILAGLRIGLGRALAAVIVAEIFLDLTGIGGVVITSSTNLRMDRMLAAAFTTAVFGMLLILALDLVERAIAPWRPGREK